MGKETLSAKSGKSDSQAVSIDWDEIDAVLNERHPVQIPDGGVCAADLAKRLGCSQSTAGVKFNTLMASGRFDVVRVKDGRNFVRYLVSKKK